MVIHLTEELLWVGGGLTDSRSSLQIQMLDPRVNQLKSAVAAVKEAVADGKVSVVNA